MGICLIIFSEYFYIHRNIEKKLLINLMFSLQFCNEILIFKGFFFQLPFVHFPFSE